MGRAGSVSMRDVAALAGVSVGTVSNVLNSPEKVLAATRTRVLDAVDKLGWVPNESARQLRAGRSNSVAMVVMDIANPFFTDVVKGAEQVLYERHYSVQIGNSSAAPERELTLLDQFEKQRVGGVLFAPIEDNSTALAGLRQQGIPVVIVDRVVGAEFCAVGVDDLLGGELAGQHLIEQGHTALAFVGGPASLAQVRDRGQGMERAVAKAGVGITLRHIPTVELSLEAGVAAAAQIADWSPEHRPSAVFAANDLLAIGLLQGFVTAGLKVPDDVAIIGYDDIAFAAAAAVPLSSISQPREQIGRTSAAMLLAEIEAVKAGSAHSHEQIRLAPELVIRRSTAR